MAYKVMNNTRGVNSFSRCPKLKLVAYRIRISPLQQRRSFLTSRGYKSALSTIYAYFIAVDFIVTLAACQYQQAYIIQPSARAPQGTSQVVDPSFPSFGIQVSSLPDYTGNAIYPNIFSRNLVLSIKERVRAPLVIRVGGTNGAEITPNFNPNQATAVEPPQQGAGIGQKFVLGPSFYEGFRNFPNTKWVYCVPFANENRTDSFGEASHAVANIGLDKLSGIEIGNEPNLYVKQGVRPAGWDPLNYTAEFLQYSRYLIDALRLPSEPILQALALASDALAPWSAEAVFTAGIGSHHTVKSVSWHHYEFTNTTTHVQQTLMNHTFIKEGANTFLSDFQYMQKHFPTIERVLGEDGRYTDKQNSLDPSEGIFGSALWTADYLLYTMSLNVTRVNMQLGKIFGYVAWHPVAFDGILPEVRAPYYGHLFAADFMGSTHDFRIKELDLGNDLVVSYAGYEHNKLERVALFNFDVWDEGEGPRPSKEFELEVPRGIRQVKVEKLTSPGGTIANSTYYWAGQTWTCETNGIGQWASPGANAEPSIAPVRGGRVQLVVGASEAVIVHMLH
ncbi:hypothetical protein F5884DRAFT_863286 [Xylogone sp. PMI_703]|nr:hypothetical protein F5884DRAFT_863286 [Xylogone sp. PMI_703]